MDLFIEVGVLGLGVCDLQLADQVDLGREARKQVPAPEFCDLL